MFEKVKNVFINLVYGTVPKVSITKGEFIQFQELSEEFQEIDEGDRTWGGNFLTSLLSLSGITFFQNKSKNMLGSQIVGGAAAIAAITILLVAVPPVLITVKFTFIFGLTCLAGYSLYSYNSARYRHDKIYEVEEKAKEIERQNNKTLEKFFGKDHIKEEGVIAATKAKVKNWWKGNQPIAYDKKYLMNKLKELDASMKTAYDLTPEEVKPFAKKRINEVLESIKSEQRTLIKLQKINEEIKRSNIIAKKYNEKAQQKPATKNASKEIIGDPFIETMEDLRKNAQEALIAKEAQESTSNSKDSGKPQSWLQSVYSRIFGAKETESQRKLMDSIDNLYRNIFQAYNLAPEGYLRDEVEKDIKAKLKEINEEKDIERKITLINESIDIYQTLVEAARASAEDYENKLYSTSAAMQSSAVNIGDEFITNILKAAENEEEKDEKTLAFYRTAHSLYITTPDAAKSSLRNKLEGDMEKLKKLGGTDKAQQAEKLINKYKYAEKISQFYYLELSVQEQDPVKITIEASEYHKQLKNSSIYNKEKGKAVDTPKAIKFLNNCNNLATTKPLEEEGSITRAEIIEKDSDAKNVIHHALEKNDEVSMRMLKIILDKGFDNIIYKDHVEQAINDGNLEALELFLNSPNCLTKDAREFLSNGTALDMVLKKSNFDLADILISEYKSKISDSALTKLMGNRQYEVINKAIKNGSITLHSKVDNGQTLIEQVQGDITYNADDELTEFYINLINNYGQNYTELTKEFSAGYFGFLYPARKANIKKINDQANFAKHIKYTNQAPSSSLDQTKANPPTIEKERNTNPKL